MYDLDEYGLTTVKDMGFHPLTEQVSLFDNQIENPGDVTTLLQHLPQLKALWLNGNPVVDHCVNFSQIGEMFP